MEYIVGYSIALIVVFFSLRDSYLTKQIMKKLDDPNISMDWYRSLMNQFNRGIRVWVWDIEKFRKTTHEK